MNDKEKLELMEIAEYKTGKWLGQRHKSEGSSPMYSDKDERLPFVIGYLDGYYGK